MCSLSGVVSLHRNVRKHGSTDNQLTALQIFKKDILLVPNVEFVTAHFIAFSTTRVALLQQAEHATT